MRCILSMLMFATIVANASSAHAGTTRVVDAAGALTQEEVNRVSSDVKHDYRFDTNVVFVSTDNNAELRKKAEVAVTSPNVISIAVDVARKVVLVRTGPSLGIPASKSRSLGEAAVPFFDKREWSAGINAIDDRAAALSASVRDADPGAGSDAGLKRALGASHGHAMAYVIFLMAAVALLFGARHYLRRRRRVSNLQTVHHPNDGTTTSGVPPNIFYTPVPAQQPMTQTTIVNAPAAPGMVDVMLGYELGQMANPVRETTIIHERDAVRDVPPVVIPTDDVVSFRGEFDDAGLVPEPDVRRPTDDVVSYDDDAGVAPSEGPDDVVEFSSPFSSGDDD